MSHSKEKVKKLLVDKPFKETKHYSKKVAAVALTAFSVAICVLAVVGIVIIKKEFSDMDAFKSLVSENYALSVFIMIFVCAIQVIIALIPGEIIEIASGYAFGTWLGTLYCLIGIILGSVTVIILSRKLGRRFVESIYPREKIDSLPILRDPSHRNAITALLFLIPGTPKDLITYIIGITEMRIPTYLLLTTAARIPSILVSTLSGSALGDNKYRAAVLFFVISGVLSLTGYLIYLKISKKGKMHSVKAQTSDMDTASELSKETLSNEVSNVSPSEETDSPDKPDLHT